MIGNRLHCRKAAAEALNPPSSPGDYGVAGKIQAAPATRKGKPASPEATQAKTRR